MNQCQVKMAYTVVQFLSSEKKQNIAFIYLYFAMPHGLWDFRFPDQGLNQDPGGENWKVLTPELPGKSLGHCF